jgi:hypothetical protein
VPGRIGSRASGVTDVPAGVDGHEQQVAAVESRVDRAQVQEASDEQRRNDEHDNAQRDLRADEEMRHRPAPPPRRDRGVLQCRCQIQPRRSPRGGQPEDHAGHERDRAIVNAKMRMFADTSITTGVSTLLKMRMIPAVPQIAIIVPSTPPQRARSTLSVRNCLINRDRPPPTHIRIATSLTRRGAPYQQQVRDVDRRDQQHDCDHAHQHLQRRFVLEAQPSRSARGRIERRHRKRVRIAFLDPAVFVGRHVLLEARHRPAQALAQR